MTVEELLQELKELLAKGEIKADSEVYLFRRDEKTKLSRVDPWSLSQVVLK